jgi:hypothetical protein
MILSDVQLLPSFDVCFPSLALSSDRHIEMHSRGNEYERFTETWCYHLFSMDLSIAKKVLCNFIALITSRRDVERERGSQTAALRKEEIRKSSAFNQRTNTEKSDRMKTRTPNLYPDICNNEKRTTIILYFFPIFFFNLFSPLTSFFILASTILYLPLTPPGLP